MTADTTGGVWSYALGLARELCAGGVEVLLVALGDHLDPAQHAEARTIVGLTLVARRTRLEWMDEPWHDVDRTGAWLLRLEQSFRPDVVHLNGLCHGALPWRAPVVLVGHGCALSQHIAVHRRPATAQWDEYRARARAGVRGADLVVAATRATLSALAFFYGPLPRAQVIASGCRPEAFRPMPKEDFVLTTGRRGDGASAIDALQQAAAQLRWPLYVADGAAREPQRRPVSAIAPVYALGPLDPGSLAMWLGKAAIYTLPTRYEPFGLSVLEAAQAGCALVLGDIPALREQWGASAIYVDPDDPQRLAAAINGLIDDPQQRATLTRESRRRALERTAAATADAFLKAYTELCAARTADAPQLAAG